MHVGQAVVCSVDSRTDARNKLVSKSDNISETLARELRSWSPCRHELMGGQSESINFIQLPENQLALSRSFFGGPENARCGGRRIFTHWIVFERDQLAGHENNAIQFSRVVQSSGHLFLQTTFPEQLPLLDVPDWCFQPTEDKIEDKSACMTDQILRAIEIHHRVVITGKPEPAEFLCSFLSHVPLEKRAEISFATGLKVIDSRPYCLQFYPTSDPVIERELASRQLRTISFEPDHTPAI